MMKRILFLFLALTMLLSTVSGISAFAADASAGGPGDSHSHEIKSKYSVKPTEAKTGILCYYCKDKDCGYYYEVEVPRLPDVYVTKYRHHDAGLCARITAAQNHSTVNGEINITMEDWFASQLKDKYVYEWEYENINARSIEFKAKDVGIGYFDEKVDSYVLTVPVYAITDCEENGGVAVYLTTGAAMVRLSEDATAALVEQAKESIGVKASCDGNELSVQLLVDGKEAAAPNGVETLYWVKDAGDMETASDDVLKSAKYMSFDFKGDFDVIYVESLNGVVNCNK